MNNPLKREGTKYSVRIYKIEEYILVLTIVIPTADTGRFEDVRFAARELKGDPEEDRLLIR